MTIQFDMDHFLDELFHVGTPRHSGRYPWGSGENPHQRNKTFLSYVDDLKKKGLTETEIAEGLGMSSTAQLRAAKAVAKNAMKKEEIAQVLRLKEANMSNVAIAREMGINESRVRALLNPSAQDKAAQLETLSNLLKDRVGDQYLDIGAGVERHLDVSKEKLNTAVSMLEEQYGYTVHNVQTPNAINNTTVKVLAPPGTTYLDVKNNMDKIQLINSYSDDGGQSFKVIQPPVQVDSKRLAIKYGDEGGAQKDGVIELRPGVDDISLGSARYAQVRIAVDGSHYLKGMAMYSNDLPPGVDIRFNTNKNRADAPNKLDALKPLKRDKATGEIDEDNPFGSIVRQKDYIGKDGKPRLSALNIVGTKGGSGEEGSWYEWSRNLSSQMLSKQSPKLAKEQLGLSFDLRKAEFDDIMSLTNPVIKKKLLEKFADGADSAAVHLKAAGLPRTAAHVILPINSLKDHEIYAPQYKNGEKVVLIRHPHGGKFEIPELVVNNNNREAKSVMDRAKDAVGINHKVAERLSGADFDGDTVLVIPNNKGLIKSQKPLAQLKDFDPKIQYKYYDGMAVMTEKSKGRHMGDISNLITDMTIQGAPDNEIARAVKHSMVVIDAPKHKLDYKQSAKDNNIKELKTKYQGGPTKGAATLISRAKSQERIGKRKLRRASEGGPIDPKTGELVWVYDTNSKATVKSTKMKEAKDARKLISDADTPMENVYADHANKLKALANEARKASLNTGTVKWNQSAKSVYDPQVRTLDVKLNTALKNAPLERKAQILARSMVTLKKQGNPDYTKEDLKKLDALAIQEARARVGAKKMQIVIEPKEWEAIQAGAISANKLEQIINNSDLDTLKQLAMPREKTGMAPALAARAKAMYRNGYTQAEIADSLGVSTGTLNDALN